MSNAVYNFPSFHQLFINLDSVKLRRILNLAAYQKTAEHYIDEFVFDNDLELNP